MRVKEKGGFLHCFVLVGWLAQEKERSKRYSDVRLNNVFALYTNCHQFDHQPISWKKWWELARVRWQKGKAEVTIKRTVREKWSWIGLGFEKDLQMSNLLGLKAKLIKQWKLACVWSPNVYVLIYLMTCTEEFGKARGD